MIEIALYGVACVTAVLLSPVAIYAAFWMACYLITVLEALFDLD